MKAIQNLKRLNLRRFAKPFLLAYHPDRNANGAATATIARDANLKAIQNLNGMIDVIEHLHDRAIDPSSSSKLPGRIDLEPCYTIEFLVPSSDIKLGEKKPKDELILTRRSIDLTFTESERNSIQNVDESGKFSVRAATALKIKAIKEIKKLLRISGLSIPTDFDDELERLNVDEDNNESTVMDELLHNELGFDENNDYSSQPGRNFSYPNNPTTPKTPYEKSRERFMQKLRANSSKFRQMYNDAVEDLKRDIATDGLIRMNEQRRKQMVSEILSRVRVYDASLDMSLTRSSTNENIPREVSTIDTSDSDGLDVIGQLIALRRMSLLFNDNFNELEMEEMGRLWEKVSFVLIPKRIPEEGKRKGLPFSRRRRMRKGKESGFKFTFQDKNCTVYVPVDFTDDEFLGEMKRHLSVLYDATNEG